MKHLFLFRELVARDVAARYAGSAFGVLWSLLQPVWQLVLFTFVFATVLRISLLGERTDNFAIYLFCGLLPFIAVSEGVSRATTAITDNADLVKKLRFPAAMLVLTVIATALLHELAGLLVFVAVLVWFGDLSWGSLPFLLLALPLQIALTTGLGLLLASLHVFLRDTAQLLGILFNTLFYLTPIVYPMAQVPEPFRRWIVLNPLTPLIQLYRRALLGGEGFDLGGVALLATVALGLLLAGWTVFARLSPGFADEL